MFEKTERPELPSEPSPDGVWTKVRLELRRWFESEAPSLLLLYEGAVLLLHEKQVPGRHHFISHAARDILNILPRIIDPSSTGPRLDYYKHLKKIDSHWPRNELVESNSKANTANTDSVSIARQAFVHVDQLVQEHRNHPTQRKRSEILIRALFRLAGIPAFEVDRIAGEVFAEQKWFMRHTHGRKKVADALNDDELKKHFLNVEHALHSIVGHYFTGTEPIDALLKEANK